MQIANSLHNPCPTTTSQVVLDSVQGAFVKSQCGEPFSACEGCSLEVSFMAPQHMVTIPGSQTALQLTTARLAQSVERKALNLVVVGSSPTVGAFSFGLGLLNFHD